MNGEGSSPSGQFLYIRWEWHYEEKGAAVDGVREVEDVAKQMFFLVVVATILSIIQS